MKKLFFILFFTALTALTTSAENPFPAARKLINAQGCKACHQLDKEGGDYARSLEEIGRRKSRDEMRKLLLDGVRSDNDRYMPSYSHLREAEIKDILDYLESYK